MEKYALEKTQMRRIINMKKEYQYRLRKMPSILQEAILKIQKLT